MHGFREVPFEQSLLGVFGTVWCESGRVVLMLSSVSWALQHSLLYGGNAVYTAVTRGCPAPDGQAHSPTIPTHTRNSSDPCYSSVQGNQAW